MSDKKERKWPWIILGIVLLLLIALMAYQKSQVDDRLGTPPGMAD